MARPRTDPVSAARALVEVLPALIEQTAGAGGPLTVAVYALRTALSEAKRVSGEADEPGGASTSTIDALRRLGD